MQPEPVHSAERPTRSRFVTLALLVGSALAVIVAAPRTAEASTTVIGGNSDPGFTVEHAMRVNMITTRADYGAIGLHILNTSGSNIRVRAWVWSDARREYRNHVDRWVGWDSTVTSPGLGDITLYPGTKGNHQVYVLVTDRYGNTLQSGWWQAFDSYYFNGTYWDWYRTSRAVL